MSTNLAHNFGDGQLVNLLVMYYGHNNVVCWLMKYHENLANDITIFQYLQTSLLLTLSPPSLSS
uniref:Uncharacterized protein n=1 Tax=Arundo donax TaxID=35708 RepID=A0A0A8YYL9_ARUDO